MLGALLAPAHARAQEPVDLLITGGTVVTVDAQWRVFDPGFVAVRGDRIVAVGPMSELDSRPGDAGERIDAQGRIVLPGLVNTHTHVPMVLFRGLADDLELEEWLNDHIFPVEKRNVTREFVAAATPLGLAEMIRGGTTTYCDMYYFEDAVAQETAKAGLRGVLGQTVLDFPAPDNPTWREALASVEAFAREWRDHPLVTAAVAPHAAYTVSTAHLQEVRGLADRLAIPVVIHIAEDPSETEHTLEHYGAPPVTYLERIGFLSPRVVGAHLVHVNDDEIQILRRRDVGMGHCPQSNMKLAAGLAPVPSMLQAGLRVGLGTDGAASNNDLNMWEEMDTAAKVHKLVSDDPTVVSARQALEMGTMGGARALHMEDEIGSLEVGKRADVILVDRDAVHLVPMYDVYSHLVYATKASDVTHTIVNGRVLMQDRRLLTLDEDQIRSDARRYRQQVTKSLRSGAR